MRRNTLRRFSLALALMFGLNAISSGMTVFAVSSEESSDGSYHFWSFTEDSRISSEYDTLRVYTNGDTTIGYNNGGVQCLEPKSSPGNGLVSGSSKGLGYSYPYPWLKSPYLSRIQHLKEGYLDGDTKPYGMYRLFDGATSLKDVVLPNYRAGYRTFYGCTSLTDVTLAGLNAAYGWAEPDTYLYGDTYTFGNCTNLKSVTFMDDTVDIYNHAFDGCTSLINIDSSKFAVVCADAFRNSNPDLVFTDLSNMTDAGANWLGPVKVDLVKPLDKLKYANANSFKDQKVNMTYFPPKLQIADEYSFYNSNIHFDTLNLSQLYTRIDKPLGDYSFCGNNITELTLTGNGNFNPKAFDVVEKLTISKDTNLNWDLNGIPALKEIWWIGGVGSSFNKSFIPDNVIVYVHKGSPADKKCEEQSIVHTHIDEDAVAPSIVSSMSYDIEVAVPNPGFSIIWGTGDIAATAISNVKVNGSTVSVDKYSVTGDVLKFSETYLDSLDVKEHPVTITFNDIYKTEVSTTLRVINKSEVPHIVDTGFQFDRDSVADVTVTLSYGTGSYKVSRLRGIYLGGRAVWIGDTTEDTVTIKYDDYKRVYGQSATYSCYTIWDDGVIRKEKGFPVTGTVVSPVKVEFPEQHLIFNKSTNTAEKFKFLVETGSDSGMVCGERAEYDLPDRIHVGDYTTTSISCSSDYAYIPRSFLMSIPIL